MTSMDNGHVITLEVDRDGTVKARTRGGAAVEGSVTHEAIDRQLIELFDDWVRGARLRAQREFEVFGSLLWRSLFPPNVEQLFESKLTDARREAARLRLQLSFDEPVGALARLPWEYLFRPRTSTRAGKFLATDEDLVLSRYLARDVDEEHLAPPDPPLRVLIVTSAPPDLQIVMSTDTVQIIEQACEALGADVWLLPQPTVDEFLYRIEETRPHVVHMIGHGRFDVDSRTGSVALLEDDKTLARWIPDNVLAEMFRQMRAIPRLVLLHLCEGAAVDLATDFSGIAPRLVMGGVQAVVGMQYPISNRAAIEFSRAFYKELARPAPVDTAVQKARWNMVFRGTVGYDKRDFGIPVLYMRSRAGILRDDGSPR